MSPRLNPIDFFGNLGRSRSLIYSPKNLKKIRGEATACGLKLSKFHRSISKRSLFPKHLTNSSKKIWGRPCSPAPIQKNLEKILGVGINNMLKFTEFRRFALNPFRNIPLSTFREFPPFSKSIK